MRRRVTAIKTRGEEDGEKEVRRILREMNHTGRTGRTGRRIAAELEEREMN